MCLPLLFHRLFHTSLRDQLLAASLVHVPEHSFSRSALLAGVHDLGLSPASIGLVPRGEIELVEYFIQVWE